MIILHAGYNEGVPNAWKNILLSYNEIIKLQYMQ